MTVVALGQQRSLVVGMGAWGWCVASDFLLRWRVLVIVPQLCAGAFLACQPPCLSPPLPGIPSHLISSSAWGLWLPGWRLPAGQKGWWQRRAAGWGLGVGGLQLWLLVNLLQRICLVVSCIHLDIQLDIRLEFLERPPLAESPILFSRNAKREVELCHHVEEKVDSKEALELAPLPCPGFTATSSWCQKSRGPGAGYEPKASKSKASTT